MADDKYRQNIHIVKSQEEQDFGSDAEGENLQEVEKDSVQSDLQQEAQDKEYESTYEQILSELLDKGLVSDDDLSRIASMVEGGNVLPFALKDRFERSKRNKEGKNKPAKDLGHFTEKASDLTVGKESGKYTEAKGNEGPVDAKEIEADRQKDPEKKPTSAPFKGPDAPTPPSTPTIKR